jgi:hypothetical protein
VRGCLFIVLFAAAVLGAVAWFGAPIAASAVIQSALSGSGYSARISQVRATSDPPPKLLLGRADRVAISGVDVDFRTLHADALELVLTDVDVIARTAGAVTGRIDGAELETTEGASAVADVAIDGSGDAAAATITVARPTVESVVRAAFERQAGVAATAVALIEPDVLRITAGTSTIEGRLKVDDSGAIALRSLFGTTTVLRFDPSFPLTLRSVAVADGGLRIDATLDIGALLGG